MMTGVIARAWKTVKPHVPLIKFRKGGSAGGQVVSQASPGQSGGKTPPSTSGTALPLIEDWQLPPRYKRAVLDEKEIEMINSGGAH